MRKVLVFGTFDRLHEGHMSFLRQARKHGDFLIAVVARSSNVKKMKGRAPSESERKRMSGLRGFAERVLLGERKVTYRLIKKINPDVICIGYDQKPGVSEAKEILRRIGMEGVEVYRMKPYRKSLYKSSILNKFR